MRSPDSALLLFSGGTDSTCAAALLAERFSELHLRTYFERGTARSPLPTGNAAKLRAHFPSLRFPHEAISTDCLVRAIAYHRYLSRLARHRLYVLATPGFSTLSWHVRTIVECRRLGVKYAADGLTRELMHFPGHMDTVLPHFRALYARFDITYENPVREWQIPRDQQFLDRLLVDRHGFVLDGVTPTKPARTTGQYLFEKGIFPHPNVKGSAYDREMQHDCYPFVLYNIFAFWQVMSRRTEAEFSGRMGEIFGELSAVAGDWLEEYFERGAASFLAGALE